MERIPKAVIVLEAICRSPPSDGLAMFLFYLDLTAIKVMNRMKEAMY